MSVPNIAIASSGKAVGKYIPKRIVTNDEIAEIFARNNVTTAKGEILSPEWMAEHVGLNLRHWAAPEEFSSDLGLIAVNRALQNGRISPFSLDLIRTASSSPDQGYPAMSCLIQNGMISRGRDSLRLNALDISAACTGGLHALISVASELTAREEYTRGIAVAGETMSKVANPRNANFQVWADAGAALVLEKTTENRGIICSIFESMPEAFDKTESIGLGVKYLNQEVISDAWFIGADVQKFVLGIIADIIPRTIELANTKLERRGKAKISLADVKMIATHQANSRIFRSPARKLGIPEEKFYVNFPDYANTSSASVLLCLVEMIEKGVVVPGDLVMLIAFGGGLLYGSVLLRI